jgi:thymidylate synthase (FAD)
MTDIEFREHSSVWLVRAQASDHMIAADARLSTTLQTSPPSSEVTERDAGLVRALMRERHGTPFEAPQFTFEIEAPIFVAREAHRHRIASISEMSSRYVELKPVFWVPPRDRPLVQVGRAMEYRLEPGTREQYDDARMEIEGMSRAAWMSYQAMLDNGVAKEVARAVLPVNVFTKWRLRINLRSALNFVSLRTRDERSAYPSKPQLEIQEVAQQMEKLMADHCPVALAAFNDGGRVAP